MGKVIRGNFPEPPQDDSTESVPDDDDALVEYDLVEDEEDEWF